MIRMLPSILRFFFSVIFSTAVIFVQAQSWVPVGTSAPCGQFDVDANENVFVYNGATVKKYNGTTWSDLGDPIVRTGGGPVYYKYLTVSNSGTAYFTFHYGDATMPPTNIRSYTSVNSGSGFTVLGGVDMYNNIETHYPCFDGVTQIAAVTDATTINRYIRVRSYASGWATISSIPISSSGGNNNAALDHDNSGNAYLLFNDSGYKLYKISGGTVTQQGSTLTGVPFNSGFKIPFCVSSTGIPYFGVVNNGPGGYSISVYKFNGTGWGVYDSDIITDPNGITSITNLTIDVSSTGIIYAGYQCNRSTGGSIAKVVYYTGVGTTWTEVGTQSFTGITQIKISSADMLYKDGCEKFDVSGITLGTYTSAQAGIEVTANASGLKIECDKTPISIAVYDFNGTLVKNYTGSIEASTEVPLSISGLYVVKVETASGLLTQKVVFVRE